MNLWVMRTYLPERLRELYEGENIMTELAINLYQRGIITAAQACRLAGLDRYQFEEILWKRQIPVHYSEKDLDKDIRYATGNI
ncbi:UPF0175 family protein [Methanospirillum sp.]|uniref:UPF0175 family protein n=1 Tax=Methanospirillum sp. TaxID=45200 RepID=UPI00359FB7D2